MPGFFKHIVCCLIGLILTLSASSQEKSENLNVHEDLMNQYELACKRCIDIKNLVKAGFTISKQDAEFLLNRFLSLNKKIKSKQDSLSKSNFIRFKRINNWFATGIRPKALDDTLHIPDIKNRSSLDDVNAFKQPFLYGCQPRHMSRKEIRHRYRNSQINRTYILLNCSAPLSYGLRIGFTHKRWGGYILGRSNFSNNRYDYLCSSDGTINNGLMFWGSGLGRRSNMSVCAGAMFRAIKWLNVYAGAGYGQRYIFWQDIDKRWAKVKDICHCGLAAEGGVIASWKSFSLSAGISTVKFKTISADFSIGINF